MKIIYWSFIFLLMFSNAYSQEHVNVFSGLPFVGMANTAPAAYNNSVSSVIAAEGGYAIDMSQAFINSQAGYSMVLDNHTKRIDTYFKGRVSNAYYRDMEEWRRSEKTRLKRLGLWNGETIRDLYRP
jgi:hypothetical protein